MIFFLDDSAIVVNNIQNLQLIINIFKIQPFDFKVITCFSQIIILNSYLFDLNYLRLSPPICLLIISEINYWSLRVRLGVNHKNRVQVIKILSRKGFARFV